VTPPVADEEPTQERVGLGLVRRPRKPSARLGRSVVVQAHEVDVAPVAEVPVELVREQRDDEPVPSESQAQCARSNHGVSPLDRRQRRPAR
jgi:hypothetical protein